MQQTLKGHSPSAEWHFSTEESFSSVCEADKHVDSFHNTMQEGKPMNKISICDIHTEPSKTPFGFLKKS